MAPQPPEGPHVVVQVITNDDLWYHRATACWPWDAATHARMQHIADTIGGEGGQALSELASALP